MRGLGHYNRLGLLGQFLVDFSFGCEEVEILMSLR
jgi:hypothetical protein